MCMTPSMPVPQPFVAPPAPIAPPPASATAATVTAAGAAPAVAPKTQRRNALRTDQGTGSTDSVATGLNIPV